jgi:hypothetical protein
MNAGRPRTQIFTPKPAAPQNTLARKQPLPPEKGWQSARVAEEINISDLGSISGKSRQPDLMD